MQEKPALVVVSQLYARTSSSWTWKSEYHSVSTIGCDPCLATPWPDLLQQMTKLFRLSWGSTGQRLRIFNLYFRKSFATLQKPLWMPTKKWRMSWQNMFSKPPCLANQQQPPLLSAVGLLSFMADWVLWVTGALTKGFESSRYLLWPELCWSHNTTSESYLKHGWAATGCPKGEADAGATVTEVRHSFLACLYKMDNTSQYFSRLWVW